ncbi:MAG: precorrin-2 C(20)-methyltransferase [Deferrisomatales bacterium]
MESIGTFYGIGVGPGDPELLTLKAVRVLREVDVVFTSAQERTGKSLALDAARPHLPEGCSVMPLSFAHTFEGVASGEAHRRNARAVLEVLRRPASAAFLTVGDPMTYSTFTYLLAAVRELEPGTPVAVVPGVTSFCAAAASAVEPLVEGDESLAVVSASRGTAHLRDALDVADTVVVMKAYRHMDEVCALVEQRGLQESATFSAECTRPEEVTVRGLEAIRRLPPRYMSLFLIRNRRGDR